MATDPVTVAALRVRRLFLSPGHNYRGRHGQPADTHPIVAVTEIRCVAGKGIEGDRWFGHKPDFKGQITFFDWKVYLALERELAVSFDPSAFRRNVLIEGADLSAWIGRTFDVQGVQFAGSEECAPCYWMDQAVAPGAEAALRGRGGLRARILTTGLLRTDPD